VVIHDGPELVVLLDPDGAAAVIDYWHTVVLTPEDLKSLPSEKSREIDVVEFVPADQIDSIRLDRSYYLEPDSKSPRSYMLMRKVLEDTDRVAVVQFTLRQKTRLGVLRVHGKVLLLQSLLWDDEVRAADFPSLDADVRIQKREVDMATSLVQSFESDFSPADFTDEYQVQLQKLVDAKLEQGESVDTDATFGKQDEDEGDGQVIDLMEALKRSVEANRAKAEAELRNGVGALALSLASGVIGEHLENDENSTAYVDRFLADLEVRRGVAR